MADPSPLSADEERLPVVGALARRFNPAMSFPVRDVWPVEVRYAWHDGADLVARVQGRAGGGREYVAVRNRDLARTDWSRLPHETKDGRPIRYYVDAPGDDRPSRSGGLSSWRERWRAIVQPGGIDRPPAESPYPPTQYAHVFWWNRASGLLAIQYWFYYPFNEWVNRHEADWEHIQVVLQGPTALDGQHASFTPVGYQYFFHERWTEPSQVTRRLGPDPGGDHPVVHVGGHGRFLAWGGAFSGGSFPQAGVYPSTGFGAAAIAPDEDVSRPERFISAEEFQVVVLPEPDRLDARRAPELSWMRLPFYAGQRSVNTNMPGFQVFGFDHPPLQPAARPAWLEPPRSPPWTGRARVASR